MTPPATTDAPWPLDGGLRAPRARRGGAAALAVAALVACGEDRPTPDAGPRTDGAADAGVPGDARAGDATPGDAQRDDGGFRWPLPTSSVAISRSDAWKSRITSSDPFVHPGEIGQTGTPQTARWVKFVVLVRDPSRVFFQDSNRYPFHYELVSEHLDPYAGKSRAEVDRLSLHEQDQELILGAVLFPPREGLPELGVQLVRQDAYHPEMARIVLDLVRRSIDTSTATRAFYFPTFEQSRAAAQDAAFFAASGFPVSSADRWGEGGACYAAGWALGRLVAVPGDQIDAAYADGRLTATDVLLTDGVPAEVPFVAGILSTTPATPNSHVAILARSYGVPFAYLRDEAQRQRVQGLVGRDVVVRSDHQFGSCEVQILDASGALTPAQRQELLDLKAPPPLQFPEKAHRGAIAADTDDLTPADARYFGGKAANFGVLRDAIPEASPDAMALSFDLWDAFMAQPLADQRTIAQTIAARLTPHRGDIAALKTALAEVRALIEDAPFPAAHRAAVLAAVARYTPTERVRFRSSTNVEDGAAFTGAGLYDSESGCPADDLDADAEGPSACDATRPKERGVFRAIQHVYASFYRDNAYLERLRRGVDESKVGMGLVVHPSYPDADELANGVATLTWGEFSQRAALVTQLGAVSVTNAEGGARAEVVDVDSFGGGTVYPSVRERSSLVQLGASVMTYPDDYEALMRLLLRVGERYVAQAGRDQLVLDLEYKKVRGVGLIVKQVREVPQPGVERMLPAFLLAETARRCTSQGESGDVFANHRMKSRWTLATRSTWLRDDALATPLFGEVTHELVEGGTIARTSGPLATRPELMHALDVADVIDRWRVPGANARRLELRAQLAREVRATESPIRTLRDGYLSLGATWTTPVFDIDFMGNLTTRADDYTMLGACPEDQPVDGRTPLVERDVTVAGKRARIAFYWPEPPSGIGAGYTAPLQRWRDTVIEGFTAQPIVLRGYWSQTYRPGHHNFTEEFIFEPRLEEGIAPGVVAELEAANVRWIHVETGFQEARMAVMGVDGVYRRL